MLTQTKNQAQPVPASACEPCQGSRILCWPVWAVMVLAVCVLTGLGSARAFWLLGESQARAHMLELAQCAAGSLQAQPVGDLRATPESDRTEAHKRVKQALASFCGSDSNLRFAYLLKEQDGRVLFLADGEPEHSPDYSAPGGVYAEATPALVNATQTGTVLVQGPYRDRWGEWVSAFAPVRSGVEGPAVAMVGVDVDARLWRRTLAPFQWLGYATTLLLAGIGGVIGLHLTRISRLNKRLHYQAACRAYAENELIESHRQLMRSEAQMRSIMTNTPDIIYRLDADGNIVFISDAVRRYGYEPADLLGRPIMGLVHPEDRENAERHVRERRTRGRANQRVELRFRAADNAPVDAEIHCVGLEHAYAFVVSAEGLYTVDSPSTGTFVGTQGVARDITERKLAQEDHARLVTAIEQAHETVVITDVQGVIQYVNPAFEQLTGYSRAEALGQTPRILKSDRHGAAFYEEMWDTLLRGEAWRGGIVNKKKDGSLFDQEACISPVWDPYGKIAHFVAVNRDVTQEKLLENQLRQAQKMEALGTLAGGIAHDFNNILGAILGNAQLGLREADGGNHEHLREIEQAAFRAAEQVRQILAFCRRAEQERVPFAVPEAVAQAVSALQTTLPPAIMLRTEIGSTVDYALGEPVQIQRVVTNLCVNAVQAMEETGGVLRVKLARADLSEAGAAKRAGVPAGVYARLSIADTGCGMDERTAERIFDPYFSTKPFGKGSGMGLAVVMGIVKSHGGHVDFQSKPGDGTVFRVYLPVCGGKASTALRPISSDMAHGNGERILLVDDELSVLHANAKMLKRIGYHVTALASPMEAWAVFSDDPDRFDAVITDYAMPQKDGIELASQLLAVRGNLPILLTTGVDEPQARTKCRDAGVRAVLAKPVSFRDLGSALRKMLVEPVGRESYS